MQREVIELRADGRARSRRGYTEAYKRRLVAMTQAPSASVSRVALQHGLNANLLFAWRRQFGVPAKSRPRRAAPATAALLPVRIERTPVVVAHAERSKADGCIEVEIGQSRVRLHGAVDVATLEVVIRILERAR